MTTKLNILNAKNTTKPFKFTLQLYLNYPAIPIPPTP